MPETTVDKYGQSPAGEQDVGTTTGHDRQLGIDSVTKAASEKNLTEANFGCRIPMALSGHSSTC